VVVPAVSEQLDGSRILHSLQTPEDDDRRPARISTRKYATVSFSFSFEPVQKQPTHMNRHCDRL
jgi:hypothetical protein